MRRGNERQAQRRSRLALVFAGAGLVLSLLPGLLAWGQTETEQSEPSKSVRQQRDSSGATLPSRVTETRRQDGNRKTKVQVIESPGLDGRYQPLLEREEQTIQVDAQTTRVVVKEYGRNSDGSRSLLRQSEEDTRALPGGGERSTRTISRPDVNGGMQAVERAVAESAPTGPDTRETRTTVLLPDVNGKFAAAERVHAVERRKEGGAAEVTTSHARPDANGTWGTYEVRKQTKAEGGDGAQVEEERVYRRDLNDAESLRERTVKRKWKDAAGREQQVEENYSRANSGADVPDNDRLPLAQRSRSVTTTGADGRQRVEQAVEHREPGNASDGLRVTERALETSRRDAGGRQGQRTVSFEDGNRSLRDTIVVDFGEKK
ncbi:MAG: hypothetical protein ACRD2R_08765 [Terriglobales bacterium]